MLGFLFNNSRKGAQPAPEVAAEVAPEADPRRRGKRWIVFSEAPTGNLSTLDGELLWRVVLWDISHEGMSVMIKQASTPLDTEENYLALTLKQYNGSQSVTLNVSKVSFSQHGGNYYVGLNFSRSRLPKNSFLDAYLSAA